jgi:tetratricopeptide (TPR) repeat protein
MTFQEDKQGKLKRQTSKQAINLAMEGRWQESVDVNKSILENFPKDVDAYNRLGKAYVELGEYTQAKEAYSQAMTLDHYNSIAKKNLARLELLGPQALKPIEGNAEKATPNIFIEEIGRAGVLNLYQIATAEKLMKMMSGDKVILKLQGGMLSVENVRGEYLGLVPTKQSLRLIKLMKGGNKYTAAVVSSRENSISVIIRETYQDPGQTDQVSFPGRRLEEVQPFISDRVFRPELEEEEEQAEGIADEGVEPAEEPAEEPEADKEWEQEA